MDALQTASKIEIVPSTLGETEFIGPNGVARIIKIDMVAGTIQISANSGPVTPGAFSYFIPNVPLSTLNPLVEELAPCVQRALQGASLRSGDATGWPIDLTDDAEDELCAADELVDDFYYRWTGRRRTWLQYARCIKCSNRIIQAVNVAGGRWVVSMTEPPGCGHGGEHEPHPRGPYARHQLVPGHELFAVELASVPEWNGTCECGTWEHADADWRPVLESHHLHAEAPAPDAPFDTPKP